MRRRNCNNSERSWRRNDRSRNYRGSRSRQGAKREATDSIGCIKLHLLELPRMTKPKKTFFWENGGWTISSTGRTVVRNP
jgi:hypothetical protein